MLYVFPPVVGSVSGLPGVVVEIGVTLGEIVRVGSRVGVSVGEIVAGTVVSVGRGVNVRVGTWVGGSVGGVIVGALAVALAGTGVMVGAGGGIGASHPHAIDNNAIVRTSAMIFRFLCCMLFIYPFDLRMPRGIRVTLRGNIPVDRRGDLKDRA